jgi:glyoxylase I family protein
MALDIRSLIPLLQVFDMPAAVRFYRDLLGFELVNSSGPGEDFGWGLLRRNGAEVMLNTAYDVGERPPSPDPARQAAHADTTLYLGCPDVDAAYRFLRDKGLAVKPPVIQRYGMKQLYVVDPDGYYVCFQWPV